MDNLKYSELFSPKQKAEAFDKIAEMFYSKNFSSATKSEIELQMFSIYTVSYTHLTLPTTPYV